MPRPRHFEISQCSFTLSRPLHANQFLVAEYGGGASFRDLTQNRLRRGVFRDIEELIMAIGDCIDRQHN
jgi:hypothetical protein